MGTLSISWQWPDASRNTADASYTPARGRDTVITHVLRGSITGTVVDRSGAGIPGVRVVLESPEVGQKGTVHYSATFAAAYTVRARRGAPVSAPCTWEEVERGEVSPRTFTIRNMAERIANVGDLWADMLKSKRSLRVPMEGLGQLL